MLRSARFLNGFLSGTVCSAAAFYFYNHADFKETSSDGPTQTKIQTTESYLGEVDPDTAKQLKGSEILKYGTPDRGPDARLYSNHVLCYDQAKKIPVWVAELITKSDLKGPANRQHSKFKMDPTLDALFSSHNKDFLGSGWSRGHMAPAGNNKFSQVIGDNSVTVPTHLFKVVTAENPQQPDSPVAVGAFIVPNQPIEGSAQLKQYKVELEDLEKSAGVYFLPRLPPSKRVDLCSVDSCQLISQEAFELYFIGRKLESAKTLERLDSVWKDLERRHLTPDDYLIDLYKKKRESLSTKP